MKWLGWVVLALGAIGSPATAQVSSRPPPRTELTVVTGAENGTFYQMARDVRRLLEEVVPEAGIDLAVVPTRGTVQNVIDVSRYGSIQLGFTQADVLAYLEIYGRGDPDARRAVGGLQVVGGLYDEDVYLIARPGINGLGDLTGKRVDVGPVGSGATVTALVLMHLGGVEPRELVNFDTREAIAALYKGRIDAFFRVVSTPAAYLTEGISPSHGFVLVPVRLNPKPGDTPLAQHYTPTIIPAHAYPWLDHPVDTVRLRSTVVTAGAPPGSPACDAIGRLATILVEQREWLRQNGHPIWKEPRREPASILSDPRVSPCVLKSYR